MHVNIHWMEVLVTAAALEEFTKLPRVIQTRVIQLTGRLAHWPNVSGANRCPGISQDTIAYGQEITAYNSESMA